MFKKTIIALLLVSLCIIFGFAQTGTYTTNEYFYLPLYGAYGLTEFNEYNAYMEIADLQIEANKLAFGNYYLKTEIDTKGEMQTIWLVTLPDLTGTPVQYDIARFADADTIEGRSYAELKADLDLEIGTDVEAHDDGLLSIAGLTTAANKSIYTTALDTYAVYDLTAFGRSILDDADAGAVRTTLGLVIGTNVLAEQTIGIADDNLLEVDDADAAVDDYCKLTTNGVVGRSYAEVKTDLGIDLSLYYLKTEMDSFSELQAIIADKTLVNTTNKLSDFAATTSAELAGVMSDEIGAGKLRFDTSVTTVTAVHTMTVAEAGTVLVSCAATPYTITLPTAVGNAGLTYHFIKTDANYFLITIDGDGTETLNYENSTSTPNLTYSRLNTLCAEATFVSDNSNWQVINEVLGQAPEFSVYLGTTQENITDETHTVINMDTESYDIGSNFNTTTHQFTAPVSGKYLFVIGMDILSTSVLIDGWYQIALRKTTPTYYMLVGAQSAVGSKSVSVAGSKMVDIDKDDVLETTVYLVVGANTVDVNGGQQYMTFFQAKLISKD